MKYQLDGYLYAWATVAMVGACALAGLWYFVVDPIACGVTAGCGSASW